jgi:hypothetical protein
MRAALAAAAVILAQLGLGAAGGAAEWIVQAIPAAGPIRAIETVGGEPVVAVGHGWFRIFDDGQRLRLVATAGPALRPKPAGALPDGRIAEGRRDIARAWLADPTERYRHGVLGDAVEAASLVLELIDRRRDEVRLGPEAVFEDRAPRIAEFGGREHIVVVKSYLAQGSALAVIGAQAGRYGILAETPPIGSANRWLNPAGIADFDGDGAIDIALVRMPHVLGRLELWSWRDGRLVKGIELADVSNHVIGSRTLGMSAVADFDHDGRPDLAIPSFDRRALRLIAFAPGPRELARVPLPARAATDFALLKDMAGRPAVLLGLENGALVIARRAVPRG